MLFEIRLNDCGKFAVDFAFEWSRSCRKILFCCMMALACRKIFLMGPSWGNRCTSDGRILPRERHEKQGRIARKSKMCRCLIARLAPSLTHNTFVPSRIGNHVHSVRTASRTSTHAMSMRERIQLMRLICYHWRSCAANFSLLVLTSSAVTSPANLKTSLIKTSNPTAALVILPPRNSMPSS